MTETAVKEAKKEEGMIEKGADAVAGGLMAVIKFKFAFLMGFITPFFKGTQKQNIFQVVLVRSVLSFFVIMATINPYGISVVKWLKGANYTEAGTYIIILLTLTLWMMMVGFTYHNLKKVGTAIGLGFYGLTVWFCHQNGVIDIFNLASPEGSEFTQLIFIIISSVLFGIGTSFIIFKRRAIGVVGVDDPDTHGDDHTGHDGD